MKDEIRFTPPLLANLLIAGLVIPSMDALEDFLECLLAPTFPIPFPPFPCPCPPVIFDIGLLIDVFKKFFYFLFLFFIKIILKN
jgi:hypothetical protein